MRYKQLLFKHLGRHSQVAKATVCKTVIPEFKSRCRLQLSPGLDLVWLHLRLRGSRIATARDSVGVLVSRSMGPADTASYFKGEPTKFHYTYAKIEAPGWQFDVFTKDPSGCRVMDRIQEALTASGWVEHHGYMADGADGSLSGYVGRNFFCLVQADWDTEDDSDSTYVREPGCHVAVTCVPRREDDFPPP